MRALPRRTTAIVLLGVATLFGVCALSEARAAAEACHRPTPTTLIAWYNHAHAQQPLNYNAQGSAIYHPISILRTHEPAVYWIGLAWLFPQSGALFAVTCAGDILDGMPSGAIGKLEPGPKLPETGESAMLVYVNKETPDCVHDAIRITALNDRKIITLWEHGYNQGINIAPSGAHPREFIAENFRLEFADAGRTLYISGTRTTYPYLANGRQSGTPSSSKTLARETWHWNAGKLRFLPEKSYRPRPVCR
ncbi:MAG: hypothetical protein ACRETQ_08695 [Gammaproteobacteria bacterium]